MKRLWLISLVALSSCTAIVKGGKLSNLPEEPKGIFLSTGMPQRPFKTVGFIQVRGYGVQIAGFADVGDAALDGVIRGTLATEAAKLGAHGVVNIEFLDENPSTNAEKAQAASASVTNFLSGRGPETKDRYVTVTGELIQFTP